MDEEVKDMFDQIDNNDQRLAELATAIRTCAELAVDRPVTPDPLGYQAVLLQDDQVSMFCAEVGWYLQRRPLADFNNRVLLHKLIEYLHGHLPRSLMVCVASTSTASNTTIHAI